MTHQIGDLVHLINESSSLKKESIGLVLDIHKEKLKVAWHPRYSTLVEPEDAELHVCEECRDNPCPVFIPFDYKKVERKYCETCIGKYIMSLLDNVFENPPMQLGTFLANINRAMGGINVQQAETQTE